MKVLRLLHLSAAYTFDDDGKDGDGTAISTLNYTTLGSIGISKDAGDFRLREREL